MGRKETDMTTKEQERKALEQIRKIVAGLGKDSYIGTAFEGCFEIAEENIENDFGCSMKQRAESAEREATAQKKLADKFAAEYKALSEKKREMSAEMDKMLDKIDYLNATVRALETEKQEAVDKAAELETEARENAEDAEYFRNRVTELNGQLKDAGCKLIAEMNENDKQGKKIEALELEVIKHKARLFDLIDKQ